MWPICPTGDVMTSLDTAGGLMSHGPADEEFERRSGSILAVARTRGAMRLFRRISVRDPGDAGLAARRPAARDPHTQLAGCYVPRRRKRRTVLTDAGQGPRRSKPLPRQEAPHAELSPSLTRSKDQMAHCLQDDIVELGLMTDELLVIWSAVDDPQATVDYLVGDSGCASRPSRAWCRQTRRPRLPPDADIERPTHGGIDPTRPGPTAVWTACVIDRPRGPGPTL